jgi:predicted RNase H-like nuclease (RuvC/YqgF family)
MLKKMTFIVLVPFALFVSNHGMFAMEVGTDEGYEIKQKASLTYARPQEQRPSLSFLAHEKWIQTSGNEDLEGLEEEMKELMEEMKKLEKEARKKVLKDILPRIKEEMEKLRERLRKWRDEEDEHKNIKVEATEI